MINHKQFYMLRENDGSFSVRCGNEIYETGLSKKQAHSYIARQYKKSVQS